jgi:hypothetical protein
MEVIAAILIISRKTRIVGLLFSAGILLNIVAVNFSFDISVKLYSCFLFFLSILLLSPHFVPLYKFLVLGKVEILRAIPEMPSVLNRSFIKPSIKTFLYCLIFLEAIYPYFKYRNFNDDIDSRPFLHGAYKVIDMKASVNDLSVPFSSGKKFFIHRDGYIVFQDSLDRTQDYKVFVDRIKQQMQLLDYNNYQTVINYSYCETDSLLQLRDRNNPRRWELTAKALNWKSMPALKDEFHWTVDSY